MTLGYITGRLAQPFNTIGKSISSLQSALLSYMRIDDVVNDDSELRGNEKFVEATICLKSVDFKYAGSTSPVVLKNININICKGETIALVGESGCGKSTLIKLMLGFYIPLRGSVELSGHDVRNMDSSDWMKHCGVVMQETKIFSGTIMENISLSEKIPNKQKVLKVLEVVGLTSYIKSLPMGIHTKIGVSGVEMSGGQKQRLMIARALYKDPDMLFR